MAQKKSAAKSAKKAAPAKTATTQTQPKQESALKGMVHPQSFDEAIKMYLDNRAKTDAQFAQKYHNTGKTVAGCIKWIYGELAKMVERKGQYAAMATRPEEIYSAAVHYFDEDTIKECTEKPAGVAVTALTTPEDTDVDMFADGKEVDMFADGEEVMTFE